MKIVVAGASGGIGQAVCKAIRDQNWEAIEISLREGLPEFTADAFVNCSGSFGQNSIRAYQGSMRRPLRLHEDVLIQPLIDWIQYNMDFNKKTTKRLHVVAISSVSARGGIPLMSEYSASRAALEAFVKSAAVELAPAIRVNAISCGAVETSMHERVMKWMSVDGKKKYESDHPLGFGHPDDVAEAVMFLLKSKWLTGAILKVDGGWSARCG